MGPKPIAYRSIDDVVTHFNDICLLNELYKELDEKIDKEQKKVEACKKKTEFETKYAQQKKLNIELTERLAELRVRDTELDRVCISMGKLTIKDNDKSRLQSAQEKCELVKQLVGIRMHLSAPQDIAKGYVKNESLKLLLPFEIDMTDGDGSEALWNVVQSVVAPGGWPLTNDKENRPHNH